MRPSFFLPWVWAVGCGTDPCVDQACEEPVQILDRTGGCSVWHRDADEDGFGDPGIGVVSCLVQDGHVLDDTDCDDADDETHPGAVESCDDVDQDCDGVPDNGAIDAVLWMVDADGDRFGDDSTAVLSCDAIPGTVRTGGDPDDFDPAAGPE